MSRNLTVSYVLMAALLALAGCGGGATGSAAPTNTLEASHSCIQCHESKQSTSPGSGQIIVAEWKASAHNTSSINNKSGFGAGCMNCHGSGFLHEGILGQESCAQCHSIGAQAVNPIKNPDRDTAVCLNCHTKTSGFQPVTTFDDITINPAIAHFTNLTTGTITRVSQSLYYTNYTSSYRITSAAGGTAVWVSEKYVPTPGDTTKYGCRACHNPHDNSSKLDFLKAWSRSGHGDTNSGSRTSRYFKSSGSSLPASVTMGSICVRCHTTTGFINYVKSDFVDVKALASSAPADHTKELTNCNVCHDNGSGTSYGYQLRNVLAANPARTGVPAYYNYSAGRGGNTIKIPSTNVSVSITYPNASSSNMCIVCHMGREVGQSIKLAYLQGLNFTNTARISAHDFAAGANLYQESGFEFYTSAAKYPQTAFLHNQAGMGNFSGTGNKGPCISCHMSRAQSANGNKSPDSHSFMPVVKQLNGNGLIEKISSTACIRCHTSTASAQTMDVNRFNTVRQGYVAAMAYLRGVILARIDRATISSANSKTKSISYGTTSAPPNWLKTCVPTATSMIHDQLQPGSGTTLIGKGAYTMGAAFNYEMLYADFGAFVHNPMYVKRLIFDSIDWLTDCTLTSDNGASECNGITDPIAKAYLCPSGVRP